MVKLLRFKLMLLMAIVLMGAGNVWGQSDKSSDYTGNVTLSTTGGTNASACSVVISTTSYDGIKAGASKSAGAIKITVPSGTKYLHIHAAGWSSESVTLGLTPNGYSSTKSISLTSNSGVSNNSPFTLSGTNFDNYYKVITFTSALTENTDITFSATSGKRFIIWGVTAEIDDDRDAAGIAFANETVTKTWGETFDGQTLTNPNNLTVSYTSTVEAVATVSATGIVEVKKAGTTMIKATFAGDTNYKPAVVSYTLTVNKAEANLSFASTSYDVNLNDDSFVAPTLDNPNGLTVTYASSNEDVAVVDDETGELVLKTSAEGKATITASFAGNDNFNAGSASYTVSIIDPNKIMVSFNDNDQEITDTYSQEEILSYTIKGITFKFQQLDATNKPRVDGGAYSGTRYARVYKDNKLTISAPANVTIQSIIFDFNKGSIKEGGDTYSNSNTQWTGNANEVSFTGVETTFINAISVSLGTYTITISDAGYKTLCFDYPLDFTASGVIAYIASVSGSNVTFTKVTSVPKNTGVLLKGTAGEKSISIAASSTDVSTNKLVGVLSATEVPANSAFVLMNGEKGVGFYKNKNAFTVGANTAYLPASVVAGARMFIGFDDEEEETTGINGVKEMKENRAIYNLRGMRVTTPSKGLYIIGGKKVVIK